MLRLRVAPSASASSLLKNRTATTSLFLFNAVRRYEYPAYGTWKGPDNAHVILNQTYEKGEVKTRDGSRAQMATGNIDITAYDESNMYDTTKQVQQDSLKYAQFKGNRNYAIDPVTNKQVREACSLFEQMDTELMWNALLRDYPALKTPLDEETRTAILGLFKQGLENLQNEEEVAALVQPVVLELLETKYIHQPMWWRISEKINLAMVAKADGSFSVRAANECTERFTKLLYNHSFEQMAWASEDYVSPHMTDICGTRQCTEAGMW